jgi:hypothetical protein
MRPGSGSRTAPYRPSGPASSGGGPCAGQDKIILQNCEVYNTRESDKPPSTLPPSGQGYCPKAHYFPPGLEGSYA